MTRLLCMRLGTGTSGTTLEPAYCETGRPYLRRTSGLVQKFIAFCIPAPVFGKRTPSTTTAPFSTEVVVVARVVVPVDVSPPAKVCKPSQVKRAFVLIEMLPAE